ncbi:hypothetical protein [Prevotella sp. 10(H)]|uniref:hypothetical protein n=1 Tax=Prevotella sp. 10(H) TaxID=1158294 RepID=UPI0004A77D4F|nr:hypothetical protein [Prevotella sp. 10(H)]
MKKNLFCSLFLIALISISFISCSDDDNIIPEPDITLKLKASKTTITPFERLTVSIDLDKDLLWESYDKVVFSCNGTWWNGIITIPDNSDERDIEITDYRLGKNKVSAAGYKDGELIGEAEIEYEVIKPTKDFFSIDWKDSNRNNHYYITHRKVETNDGSLRWNGIWLTISPFPKDTDTEYEYACIDIMPHSTQIHGLNKTGRTKSESSLLPDIDNYDFCAAMDSEDESIQEEARALTESFFHEYITLIYGKSIARYEGEDVRETTLWDEYNKRFKNKLGDNIYPRYNEKYPVEIWETPTSNICLYAIYRNRYYIVAEPRS